MLHKRIFVTLLSIYIYNYETKENSLFYQSDLLIGDLDWSSDDESIYVKLSNSVQGRSLFIIDIDDGNLTQDTPDNYYGSPAVSPSGESIVFVGSNNSGFFQLYKTDLISGNVQQLTSISDCNVSSPQWYDFAN